MNERVKKLLLAGYKFMPEMHLKQAGFAFSACWRFTKNKERIEKFKKQEICHKELDSACFQHDMAYGDFKNSTRRTASNKTFRDKAFNNAKNLKYDRYQRGLASMVYKVFVKKFWWSN